MSINFASQINSLYGTYVSGDAAYQSPGTYNMPAAAISGGVTLAATAAGTGYTSIPTIAVTADTFGGSGAAATALMKVLSATVNAGGSGGTNGTQTVTGTTGTGTKFSASVTVSSGAISAVLSITVAGSYSVMPTTIGQEPVTGAGLTGAKLALTMGVGGLTQTATGSGYAGSPTAAFSGGGGSGATIGVTLTDTSEQRLLVMIELIRAYLVSVAGPDEVKSLRDLLERAILKMHAPTTLNATTLSTKVQRSMIRRFINQRYVRVNT